MSQAHLTAWIDDPKKSPSKLKVQFIWPFRSDYWVIDLGVNYEYAVVSEPSRENLWILSRTPQMAPEVLKAYSNAYASNTLTFKNLIMSSGESKAEPEPEPSISVVPKI